jgi:hypothetical protein
MLGDRRFGTHAKAAGDLSVGRFVTVLGEEARDVIKNFFLSLSAWQHLIDGFRGGRAEF